MACSERNVMPLSIQILKMPVEQVNNGCYGPHCSYKKQHITTPAVAYHENEGWIRPNASLKQATVDNLRAREAQMPGDIFDAHEICNIGMRRPTVTPKDDSSIFLACGEVEWAVCISTSNNVPR